MNSTVYLLPSGNWSPGKDEHYGCDIQGTPYKEGQRSSAAPHRGQPGEADEQDGAEAKDHAHHWQSTYMDVNVLKEKGRTFTKKQVIQMIQTKS